MDNLTHALTGAGFGLIIANTVAGAPFDAGLVATAVVASQVPDIDALSGALNKTSYLKHHRGISHSLLMAPFLAMAIAYVMGFFFTTSFWLMSLSAYLSLVCHIGLDIFNAYGTKALWPISHKRYALDVLMVIDPIILLWSGAAIAGYLYGYAWFLYLLYPGIAVYILGMVFNRYRAKCALHSCLPSFQEHLGIMPPNRGWREWNFIVLQNNLYYLGRVNIARGVVQFIDVLDRPTDCDLSESTKNDPQVQIFLDFARFPYHCTHEDMDSGETYIQWSDLRYKLRGKEHFTLFCKAA